MALPFADRTQAGRELATTLAARWADAPVVVLGLPRGGVPVAAQVAAVLHCPFDVFMVRKLGVPGQPELAMGAIATGGMQVLNPTVVSRAGVSDDAIEQTASRELLELHRREREYRGDRPMVELAERIAILVDDGLATGATMRAAVQAVRAAQPERIVVAVPVGAPQSCDTVAEIADELVCLHTPSPFGAVGTYYDDFTQTSDEEVASLLSGRGAS